MASTGTQTTWSSNGGYYLRILWEITSQSVANNRSGVRVRMYFGAKSGWNLSDSSNSWSLTVDGSTSSGNANISVSGNEDLIEDRQFFIDHNSDGTKSISINGAISGLYFGGINPSSFTANLDAIPRASTISSTATLNADYNSNVSITRYSSNFSHTLDIYLTKSGVADRFIKQLSYSSSVTSRSTAWDSDDRYKMFRYGHGYWTGTRMVLKTYLGSSLIGTTEKTGSFGYPSINSVGSINDFTLGNNASASISKASELYSHQIELRIGSTVVGSNGFSTGTNFDIAVNPTTVLNALPTSKTGTVSMFIRTVLASNTAVEVRDWTNEGSAIVTIPNTYAPTFTGSQFTYADTNSTIVRITGSNQTLVSGLSTLQVNINSSAVASTGATITSYSVTAGDKSGSRAGTGAVSLGVVKSSSSTVQITVTAIDSRGFQTSASKTVNILPYQKPTVVGNATRNNGFDETVTIRTSGAVNRLVVDGVAKNNITTLQYRTKLTTASWGTTWTNIPFTAPTGTNTAYTASNRTVTIPRLESWNIEVKATDTLGSTTSVIYTVSAGTPLVFMDTTLNAVGIGTFPISSNELRVAGNVVGSRLLATNHTLDVDGLSGGGTSFIKKSGNQLVLNDEGFNTEGIKLVGDVLGTGKLSANLTHSGDYFNIRSYSPTYGAGQAEIWYSDMDNRLRIGSRSDSNGTIRNTKLSVNDIEVSNITTPSGVSALNLPTTTISTLNVTTSYTGGGSITLTGTTAGFTGYALVGSATNLLLRATGEVRVVTPSSSGTYIPVRASSFPTSSSINYKTNLESVDSRVNALELIKETDIWHYHLKSNLESGIYDKPKVGVIAEMVNPLIRDEDGIDLYSMIALSWKAHQQQSEIIQAQADEIKNLKAQNEAIFDMLQDLQNQIDEKNMNVNIDLKG